MSYFSKKVRLFSQNDVLFLFYFLINLTMTTDRLPGVRAIFSLGRRIFTK